ncbi:MAG: hypothetical protein JEZ02_03895 [Desulfatibacillum sp.]|nr:hypothetical protein [Desulfatibacillum sp.]
MQSKTRANKSENNNLNIIKNQTFNTVIEAQWVSFQDCDGNVCQGIDGEGICRIEKYYKALSRIF